MSIDIILFIHKFLNKCFIIGLIPPDFICICRHDPLDGLKVFEDFVTGEMFSLFIATENRANHSTTCSQNEIKCYTLNVKAQVFRA